MLDLFNALLFLLQFVEMDACLLGDEEVDGLLGRVHPLHHEYLLEVFFDGYLRLAGCEVSVELAFRSEEEGDVFFVVVGEIGDEVYLA